MRHYSKCAMKYIYHVDAHHIPCETKYVQETWERASGRRYYECAMKYVYPVDMLNVYPMKQGMYKRHGKEQACDSILSMQ